MRGLGLQTGIALQPCIITGLVLGQGSIPTAYGLSRWQRLHACETDWQLYFSAALCQNARSSLDSEGGKHSAALRRGIGRREVSSGQAWTEHRWPVWSLRRP